MINFGSIDVKTFLTEFWQKKPLVIRNAIPGFNKEGLSADELAGLSMEEDIDSRMVIATPNEAPYWHLRKGPFVEQDFQQLPPSHWTLLVQGVDRLIPELALLFEHFNFIPQWRVDDLMISYASEHGSVGPHYDNYDVFLYQAQGSRRWSLTTQQCHEQNYLPDVPLRIMREFHIEEEFVLEEGDMLYLPPHVGHYGTAISKDCMTYSFGYRSYSNRELWDSFGDFCAEVGEPAQYYQDPNWSSLKGTAEMPRESWLSAKALLQAMLDNEEQLRSWFGCFATQLDAHAEALLPEPVSKNCSWFLKKLSTTLGLKRHPICRFSYQRQTEESSIALYVNGREWCCRDVSVELIELVGNNHILPIESLRPWLSQTPNQHFLFELWTLQWLGFLY